MLSIKKIISGGQTGGDRGGLDAGIELGLELGGACPADYRADDERIPEYYARYLRPTNTRDYGRRTRLNVRDSDLTAIFAFTRFLSGGSLLTRQIADQLNKPWLHIVLSRFPVPRADIIFTRNGSVQTSAPDRWFRNWLSEHRVITLNVAGPRKRKAPGIQEATCAFLVNALRNQ